MARWTAVELVVAFDDSAVPLLGVIRVPLPSDGGPGEKIGRFALGMAMTP
jgi:hypothetical protein